MKFLLFGETLTQKFHLKNFSLKYITLIAFLFSSSTFAQQELFISRNILPAYEKGTRSYDGKPGEKYWQNSSEYKIEVQVDPSTYLIDGSEEIIYHNNSPDTLKKILLRLYPNIFKKGSARDYQTVPEAINDGVFVKKIIIGNDTINLSDKNIYSVRNTLSTINLKNYIPPKSSIKLSIDWNYNISVQGRLRIGVYDSTSVFVGYWYPQIAVYDDISGWDQNDYSGQEEFYNDFAEFEVNITMPNNFGVWATGTLQNPQEVLAEETFKKYSSAKLSDTVIRIISKDQLNSKDLFNSDKSKNTWIYKASKVTDFAFAFSDHYLWDGLTLMLDSLSNHSVFIQTVYPSNSPDFHEVAEISKELIKYFSTTMPGIIFPFNSFTAFNNGRSSGGMEFPMLINDGSPQLRESTVNLTSHEIAHQYFPFFVGTNEHKYAFMDEGMAVLLPFKYMEKLTGDNKRLTRTVSSYKSIAGTENDIPPIIPSLSLTYSAYRNSAYDRPSIAYEFLHDMLGEELFIKCLQEYINRWKGKHPIPFDFFFTFNEVSGKDLNWFWIPWFFEIGYPDLSIDKASVNDGKVEIIIKKIGLLPTPINITIYFEDGSNETIYYSAEVWKYENTSFQIVQESNKIIKEIKLGSNLIPDVNSENDLIVIH
ncbi:MAG: M1 family metallopeptidase [Ignavibacteriales bacterium]